MGRHPLRPHPCSVLLGWIIGLFKTEEYGHHVLLCKKFACSMLFQEYEVVYW